MTDKSLRVYFLYVGFVCLIFVVAWHRPLMSPDSWALYDLSRWLWHGETVTGIRQYRVGTGLPISHPFFFPFLSGGLDQLFGTGFRSGLVVNIAAILLLPWLIYLAIKPIAESRKGAVFISWGATVGLCLNWFFLEEVVAGRTIPVAACLVALALRFFFLGAQQRNLVFAIQLGLVLGVLALTRFDTLSFGLILAVGTWLVWAPGRKRWMALLITTVLFLVGYAPYLVYSIQCCGTVLATETRGIAITAPPTSPTTYWPVPPPTLLDAPTIWMERLVRSMLDSGRALLLAVLISLSRHCSLSPRFFQARRRNTRRSRPLLRLFRSSRWRRSLSARSSLLFLKADISCCPSCLSAQSWLQIGAARFLTTRHTPVG